MESHVHGTLHAGACNGTNLAVSQNFSPVMGKNSVSINGKIYRTVQSSGKWDIYENHKIMYLHD